MKKIYIFIILLIQFSENLSAQTLVDTTSLDIEAESSIKADAEHWFKEVYVESAFKDPYSYKLMGIKIIPVTTKQGLEKQLIQVVNSIENCIIQQNERNQNGYEEYMMIFTKNSELAKKEQEFIERGENVDYHVQKKSIFIKYAEFAREQAESIAVYLEDLKEKERLEEILNRLSDSLATSIGYYDIRLDCYSKNSLGNEVLGRFSFPFTENGPLYGNDTIYYVINLND
jgi:23S rRNA maturation mini-RNase III